MGQDYILVLVFAATLSEMALMVILFDSENKMSKLSMHMSKSKKVKMNYSSHGGYKGIHLVFSLFSLHSS